MIVEIVEIIEILWLRNQRQINSNYLNINYNNIEIFTDLVKLKKTIEKKQILFCYKK